MIRKIVAVWVSLAMLLGFVVIVDVVIDITPPVKAASTLYVGGAGPGNYSNIQWAIDNATDGDTVFVYNGTYYENVVVNKTINLTGEDRDNTIIDGLGINSPLHVISNWVNISGFNITRGGSGPESAGIYFDNVFNCHVFNNNISKHAYNGIYLHSSNNNNISDNNVNKNDKGIYLYLSSDNIILNNKVSNNYDGIILRASEKNNIFHNNIHFNVGQGIYLWNSGEETLSGNNMTGRGLYIYGILLSHWNSNEIDISNTINEKPVYYWKDRNGGIIPDGAGQVILANCNNVQVINQELTYGSVGIELGHSSNNNLSGNNVSNNIEGLILIYSDQNIINNNTAYNNKYDGIYLGESDSNTITFNNFSHNGHGFELWFADENIIKKNIAFSNDFNGIFLDYSYQNNLTRNIFLNNIQHGIHPRNSKYNIINENVISKNNNHGIYLDDSSSNWIYHNVMNNSVQAYDNRDDNSWDDGYPSGGNYWLDYGGIDNFKGPLQDISGKDGIGDINYTIDSDSKDNYPLMGPYPGPWFILEYGWNLNSIPAIQSNTTLPSFLASLEGQYDAVQFYNSTDGNDHWKHYHISKLSQLNDLIEINHKQGFWIHITNLNGTIFRYDGLQPSVNQTINLHPGWNMVGYPSLINRTRDNALNNINFGTDVDAIWTFNAATQTWQEIGPSDYFELGRGYWMHSKVTKTWDVPL